MKVRNDQTGFSPVSVAVIVGVAAALGLLGWFAYSRQNKEESKPSPAQITSFDECVAAGNPVMESYPEQCTANGKTFTKTIEKHQLPEEKDETADWLLYESPGKEYSLRLADGWQMFRYEKSPSIYTYDNKNLALMSGTKAKVTEVQGGSDGQAGLFINHATENIEQIVTPGAKQTSLKTIDGLEVEKYYWIVNGYGEEGLGNSNGDTQYTYVIRKSAKNVMTVNYSFAPGATDYHELVEKVIKTISIK